MGESAKLLNSKGSMLTIEGYNKGQSCRLGKVLLDVDGGTMGRPIGRTIHRLVGASCGKRDGWE